MTLPGIARIAGKQFHGKDVGLMVKLTSKTNLRPKEDQFLKLPWGSVGMQSKLAAVAVRQPFTGAPLTRT